MIRRRKLLVASIAAVAALAALGASAAMEATASAGHPTTGVGSCTLTAGTRTRTRRTPRTPSGKRPMTYRPDDFDCTGAVFAGPGVEFAKFPQPHDFNIENRVTTRSVADERDGTQQAAVDHYWQPTKPVNPLAPYFPPFTHFVIIYRENHTFDDYLGDCATTVHAGCNGKVVRAPTTSARCRICTSWPRHTRSTTPTAPGPSRRAGPTTGGCSRPSPRRAHSSSRTPSAPARSSTASSAATAVPRARAPAPARDRPTGSGTGSSPYTFVDERGHLLDAQPAAAATGKNPATARSRCCRSTVPARTSLKSCTSTSTPATNQSVSDTQVANDYLELRQHQRAAGLQLRRALQRPPGHLPEHRR